ncbi:MAG: PIN domain-containing protein [Nanoarchaeota archaeon]
MDEVGKCLDTYALIEIARGNLKFAKYFKFDFIIADLTLAEFYSVLLREESEEFADYWFKKLEHYSHSVGKEILIEAVKFRQENKKSGISFFDAVGYIFALKNKCWFVTGDKEFEGMKNVEFVKK